MEGSEPSELDSKKGLSEYGDEYSLKGGSNAVLLRQMRQMKYTIKTLMEINQDQHWKFLELADEKTYLTRQVRELNRQLQLAEAQMARRPGEGPLKPPEDPYDLIKVSPPHPRPFVPSTSYKRSYGIPPKKAEGKVTERIQELLDSSRTSSRPIVVPFAFDNFGSGAEEKMGGERAAAKTNTNTKAKAGCGNERQAQYQARAELFVNTAFATEKPQGPQATLPLIKRLENSLREGISGCDRQLLAETILQVKEKKMTTLIDLGPAEKKLYELLTSVPLPTSGPVSGPISILLSGPASSPATNVNSVVPKTATTSLENVLTS